MELRWLRWLLMDIKAEVASGTELGRRWNLRAR